MMTGLKIINNFLDEDQERGILLNLPQSFERKSEERNSVVRYGSKKPYNGHIFSSYIPDFLEGIAERFLKEKLLDCKPDSVTINEYFKGQGLKYHVDSPASGKIITVLSLLGDAVLLFKRGNEIIPIEVPRRSLLQLSDEARNDWKHAVEPQKERRYSIVFRCSI